MGANRNTIGKTKKGAEENGKKYGWDKIGGKNIKWSNKVKNRNRDNLRKIMKKDGGMSLSRKRVHSGVEGLCPKVGLVGRPSWSPSQ